MNYYRNKDGDVYAYDDEQLQQIAKLTECEISIEKAMSDLSVAELVIKKPETVLNDVKKSRADYAGENEAKIAELDSAVSKAQSDYDVALSACKELEIVCNALKSEYNSTRPIIFTMRENVNTFHKMADEEVEAHINPPKTQQQLVAEVTAEKQALLAEATVKIDILNDTVEYDEPTEEETVSLNAWRKYRVAVSRVDVNKASDIKWPEKPE